MRLSIKLPSIVYMLMLLVSNAASGPDNSARVSSPNEKIKVLVSLNQQGGLQYAVGYNGEPLLLESRLGLKLADGQGFEKGLSVTNSSKGSYEGTWTPVTGERSTIVDRYNGLVFSLSNDGSDNTRLQVKFRAYDEGVAFCYEFPDQQDGKVFTITEELSQFRFSGDHFCWDTKDPQAVYRRVPISQVGADSERPLLVEVADGPYVALGEARLVDYARLRFKSLSQPNTFGIELGSHVEAKAPYASPWRYIMIGDTPGKLVEQNDIVANLNDPCAIEDPSWIKPGKVIRTELNTKTAKATVDWANKIGASYILIDAGWYGPETSDKSDATTVTIDPKRYSGELDMQGVIDYPTAHEVGVILYVNCRALERQLDDLLPLFQKWGVAGIKFGFVNVGSQKWTKWVHDSVRKCADYKMVVDIHDDYRPTGGSRTYPNLLTQEGIKGNETMPTREENVILPFTRYLCGAADYTVCYYSSRIKTTRAPQLAASIVYYSPIQLLFWYDKPANVKDTAEMEVFKQLHTTWDESKIIHGEIGSFITTARRNGEQWFVGSMNAGERRELKIPLNFLQPGLKYQASIYSDAFPDGSDSKKVNSASIEVTSETVLTADMASNGGQAIVLTPVSNVQ